MYTQNVFSLTCRIILAPLFQAMILHPPQNVYYEIYDSQIKHNLYKSLSNIADKPPLEVVYEMDTN